MNLRTLAVLALVTVGCASTPEPCKLVPYELFVEGASTLNLNIEGQSMPVELRAYFLSERDLMEKADFEAVWQRAEETLGATLLKKTSFTVVPGEHKISPISVPPATSFIALVALFRQIDGDQWRKIIDARGVSSRCREGGLHIPIRAALKDNRVIAPERIE